MPAPSSSLATLRPDIAESFTEFDIEQNHRGFVWDQLMPVFDVAKASGNFGRIPVEQLLQQRDTKRAPGSGYARGKWNFVPDVYVTVEHGAEEPVDDNEAQMYADYFDAEQISGLRARDAVLSNAERRVIDALLSTSTFANGAASAVWTNASGATPIDDVEAAIIAIYDACGLWANTIGMSYKTFRLLRNCDQIIERIQSNGAGDRTVATDITVQQLEQVFDIPKIVVAGATENSANEGQAATFGQIWDESKVWIGVTADSNDIRKPCVGRTFHWSQDGSSIGGTVESYRDETVRADIIRVRHQVGEKILYPEAARIITGVKA
jgi:hypothetical protein